MMLHPAQELEPPANPVRFTSTPPLILIAPRLEEDLEVLAFVVYRPPQILPFPTDRDKDLVQMPTPRSLGAAPADPRCLEPGKLQDPGAHCLIRDLNASL